MKIVGLKHQIFQALIESKQYLRIVVSARSSFRKTELGQEGTPGTHLWICFSQRGKNSIDIALEDIVGSEEKHLVGTERFSLTIEQVCNALQHY